VKLEKLYMVVFNQLYYGRNVSAKLSVRLVFPSTHMMSVFLQSHLKKVNVSSLCMLMTSCLCQIVRKPLMKS
jgi:hypothetical protein